MSEARRLAALAKRSCGVVGIAPATMRSEAISAAAREIRVRTEEICAANERDLRARPPRGDAAPAPGPPPARRRAP